jgi:hypothetical protein
VGLTIVTHSHAATDRVSRLLMPLSTWLVIHKEDSTSTTPFSNPTSLNRDVTPPPTSPDMFHLQHGKSSHIRRPPATAHSTTAAPEELMPRTLSPSAKNSVSNDSSTSQRPRLCLTDSSSLPPPHHEAGICSRRTTPIKLPGRSGWPARASLAPHLHVKN